MNKIAVLIPFFGRETITKLCFNRLKSQSKRYKFDVITVGSEGEKSKELAESFGFKYYEAPNDPLSHKLNAGMQECKKYDGVIVLGSDNFVTPSLFKAYQEVDCEEEVFYSVDDLHIYSTHHRKLATGFKDYFSQRDNPSGVARFYTKAALKLVDYQPWGEPRNSGLDFSSQETLRIAGAESRVLEYKDHFILDVKHEDNISNPAIVQAFDKDDLSKIEKLGKKIAKDILDLKPGKVATRKKKPVKGGAQFEKVGVVILEAFHQYKKHQKILLPKNTARALVKKGYAKYVKNRHEKK